jgi:hypothetical protein
LLVVVDVDVEMPLLIDCWCLVLTRNMSDTDSDSVDNGEVSDGSPMAAPLAGPHEDGSSEEDEDDLYGNPVPSPRRTSPRMQSKGREKVTGLPTIMKALSTIPARESLLQMRILLMMK